MSTVRMTLDPAKPPQGRVDWSRVDATTEADIQRHEAEDDAAALLEAGDDRAIGHLVALGEEGMASGVADGFDIDAFVEESRTSA